MREVLVPREIYHGFTELRTMVDSLVDPKGDPKKERLLKAIADYREMLTKDLRGALKNPELLAFAFFGQTKFTDKFPKEAWFEQLPHNWIAIAPYFKCGKDVAPLIERCKGGIAKRQLLCQAIAIVFLNKYRREIEVLPRDGEIACGDLYGDQLETEGGDGDDEQ